MKKPLSERSLEELWQLFPIFLTPHQPAWANWFEQERQLLLSALPQESLFGIHHIGSTAVDTIQAKPIVDILVVTTEGCDWGAVYERLFSNGYLLMSEEKGRASFNKGYTETGFAQRVFHLHLRRDGDQDELYFRDYLRTHPAVARAYEALKLSLWRQYEHDRDRYTQGKTAFVRRYTRAAKWEAGLQPGEGP